MILAFFFCHFPYNPLKMWALCKTNCFIPLSAPIISRYIFSHFLRNSLEVMAQTVLGAFKKYIVRLSRNFSMYLHTKTHMHTIFVIFGATGDLAKRKLFGALYNIYTNSNNFDMDIIGVGRRDFDKRSFIEYIDRETGDFIEKKEDFIHFLETIHYSRVELDRSEDYSTLKNDIRKLQKADSQVVFYLSISPEYFPAFVDNYKHIALENTKVIFEKPFGTDLRTARILNMKIREVFEEEQVYRIDHYVGKEAVQNILAFRFANTIFEAIWNNKYIDNIQITASESIGVGDRGGYYDKS